MLVAKLQSPQSQQQFIAAFKASDNRLTYYDFHKLFY